MTSTRTETPELALFQMVTLFQMESINFEFVWYQPTNLPMNAITTQNPDTWYSLRRTPLCEFPGADSEKRHSWTVRNRSLRLIITPSDYAELEIYIDQKEQKTSSVHDTQDGGWHNRISWGGWKYIRNALQNLRPQSHCVLNKVRKEWTEEVCHDETHWKRRPTGWAVWSLSILLSLLYLQYYIETEHALRTE